MKVPVLDARVLLVDDDDGFSEAARSALRKSFHEVHRASSEIEAWALLEKHRYDVVLLDIVLGHKPSGLGICRKIKADPDLAATTVLLVTDAADLYGVDVRSYVGEDDCLPADGFLEKSSGIEMIVKQARSVVEKPSGHVPSGTRPCPHGPGEDVR